MSPTPLDLGMFALPYHVDANGIGLAATATQWTRHGMGIDGSRF